MSRHSKARRDARRKRAPAAGQGRTRPALEPHAELAVDGAAVGVVARQGEEWVLFLDGRPVASTGSAAMTMAMLKHVAGVREAGGGDVRLAYSTALRAAATSEADAQGHTLHDHLALLEAERAARLPPEAPTGGDVDGPAGDTDAAASGDARRADPRVVRVPRSG